MSRGAHPVAARGPKAAGWWTRTTSVGTRQEVAASLAPRAWTSSCPRAVVPVAVVRSGSVSPRTRSPPTWWTVPSVTVQPWAVRRAAVAAESWLPIVATRETPSGTAWLRASTQTCSGSEPVMVRSPSSMWTVAPATSSRTPTRSMTSRLQCRSVVSTAVTGPRRGPGEAGDPVGDGLAVSPSGARTGSAASAWAQAERRLSAAWA